MEAAIKTAFSIRETPSCPGSAAPIIKNTACLFLFKYAPYQAGRSKHWIKVKNRTHPAMYRVMDALA
jgi:hypothetical protein